MSAKFAPHRLAIGRWLVLRRITQVVILGLFLLGPWAGLWLVKGNLSSSLTLDVLPLTDPLLILQMLAAGHWPYREALLGVALVVGFYLLVGGRVFCSWVCPINPVTDAAVALRRRLGLKGGHAPAAGTRYWLLAGVVLIAAVTGTLPWEAVNPVSMLHRGLIFGFGLGGVVVLGVFLYDLLLAPRGWCGHLCPMGATYALLGQGALMRVSASERERCDDCLDCFAVCPEPQVIRPALKGSGSPLILAGECSNCARCIEVCEQKVFRFTHRFDPVIAASHQGRISS